MSARQRTSSAQPERPADISAQEDGHRRDTRADGMVEMARDNARFHLAPAPGAIAPEPEPFPRPIIVGLLVGAIGGGLLGFGFATLLLQGVIVMPGWEQLYAMSPGTFATFWIAMGIALGVLFGGVGTTLATPATGHSKALQSEHARSSLTESTPRNQDEVYRPS